MGVTTFNPVIPLWSYDSQVQPPIGHNSLFWYNFHISIYSQDTPLIHLMLTLFCMP